VERVEVTLMQLAMEDMPGFQMGVITGPLWQVPMEVMQVVDT